MTASKDTSAAKQLPWSTVAVVALQHVIVVYSGIELAPLLLSKLYHLNTHAIHYMSFTTLLVAAASTLLQLKCFKGRFPLGVGGLMFMGTSTVFMSSLHAALKFGGFSLFCTMSLMAVPFLLLFSYFFRHLRRIMTPTVGGVVVMLAVVSLLKDATNTWISLDVSQITGHWQPLTAGSCTISTLILLEWFGGRKVRHWALAIGIGTGFLISYAIGIVDMTAVRLSPLFGIPAYGWPGFAFSNTPDHWALMLTFIISALVATIKLTGDTMALQQVTHGGTQKIDYDSVQGGLNANAFSVALAACVGALPATSHSANIPIVEMTGVTSRKVGFVGAAMLVVLAFSPKITMFMYCIPGPVIGGAAVVLVAHLFSTGIRLCVKNGIRFREGLIAGLSLSAGIMVQNEQFLVQSVPHWLVPIAQNGFAVGGLVAIALTMLTNLSVERRSTLRAIPKLDALPEFKSKLLALAERMELRERTTSHLELCCEEVFLHMLEEVNEDHAKYVCFKILNLEDKVHVEVVVKGVISDVDDEERVKKARPTDADADELNDLGLFILNRLAQGINHIHISGYAYIGFDIPKQS